jgi:hypothetical protein
MLRLATARSVAYACGWLTAIAVLAAAARLAGGRLPDQAAVAIGLAASLGVPGFAVLRVSGLSARLDVVERLAVVPLAGLAAWAVVLAGAMLLHLSLAVTLAVLLTASALALAGTSQPASDLRKAVPAVVAGLAVAAVAARVQRPLMGDGFFHAGRIRKLVDLNGLSVSGLSSYLHGHPHAGYGFPVFHAAEAGAVQLAGVDAAAGYVALEPAAAFLLGVVYYALGSRVAGMPGGVAAALLICWDGIARPDLTLSLVHQAPGFTASVLYPGLVILLLAWQGRDDPRVAGAVVVGVLILTATHPTYGPCAVAAVAGACAVRRRGLAVATASGAAVLVVAVVVWWVALHGAPALPTSRSAVDTVARIDGHTLALRAATIVHDRFELFAVVLAIPVLALARGRRFLAPAGLAAWPLALVALPGAATLLSPIGPGQMRRLWFGVPWVMVAVLVIAAVAARLSRRQTVAAVAALAAASLVFEHSGWPWPWISNAIVWSAAAVASAAILWTLIRGPAATPLRVPSAAMLPVLALTIALSTGSLFGFGHAAAAALERGPETAADAGLPARLVDELRRATAARPLVVLARPPLAYKLLAEADLYAVALPKARSRADLRNAPLDRIAAVDRFFRSTTTASERGAILREYDVNLVVARRGAHIAAITPGLQLAGYGGAYAIYRVA